MFLLFFFKQKTAYEMRISDWSSDVCSSDLVDDRTSATRNHVRQGVAAGEQIAFEIDVHRHVPEIKRRLDCVNILAQFTERDISGVVVQDVNAAEMRHGLVHQRLDRCLVCAVETDRDGLAAKFGRSESTRLNSSH